MIDQKDAYPDPLPRRDGVSTCDLKAQLGDLPRSRTWPTPRRGSATNDRPSPAARPPWLCVRGALRPAAAQLARLRALSRFAWRHYATVPNLGGVRRTVHGPGRVVPGAPQWLVLPDVGGAPPSATTPGSRSGRPGPGARQKDRGRPLYLDRLRGRGLRESSAGPASLKAASPKPASPWNPLEQPADITLKGQ